MQGRKAQSTRRRNWFERGFAIVVIALAVPQLVNPKFGPLVALPIVALGVCTAVVALPSWRWSRLALWSSYTALVVAAFIALRQGALDVGSTYGFWFFVILLVGYLLFFVRRQLWPMVKPLSFLSTRSSTGGAILRD